MGRSEIIGFVKSKIFLRQTIYAVLLISVLLWLVFKILNVYTQHGEAVDVPDFTGLKTGELAAFVSDKPVTYKIVDSLYEENVKKRGMVIRQDPLPGEKVKEGRIIYLYVSSRLSEQVRVPKLLDKSLRQALATLDAYGLKAGKITEVPNEDNYILFQKIKGKDLEPGTMVDKGTAIDLWVGEGKDKKFIPDSLQKD